MLEARCKPSFGYSLVELMIATTISASLITALISFVSANLFAHTKLMMQQRLSDEINSIVSLLKAEISRAGFDAASTTQYSFLGGSHSAFKDTIALSSFPGESPNSCILFAYDRNLNGELDSGQTNESYGFRLRDRAIEMRQRGAPCNANGWQDLSDSNFITIEHFSIQAAGNLPPENRITVRLDASVKQDPSIQMSTEQSWRIANAY